jgi:hypothetical protein
LGQQRGKLELGLHFESRDRALNLALLKGFSAHMAEIKSTLGPQWEAEPWDKGWTKVYEVVPYAPFDDELLRALGARMARAISVLQPIWESLRRS